MRGRSTDGRSVRSHGARSRGARLNIVTPARRRSAAEHAFHLFDADLSRSDSLSPRGITGAALSGTVEANVDTGIVDDYARRSEMLTEAKPLAALRELIRSEASGPRLRPADLAEELALINDEIHRIMAKVELAVSRLKPRVS